MLKKVETLVALYQKKQNTFRILFKKMKHFLRLFKKHLKHFSPSVEKIDTLFAFSQKKIEYLLQLVKKNLNFFATSWKSKKNISYFFHFFLLRIFWYFRKHMRENRWIIQKFLLKNWHDHYLQIHNHQKNSQFFLTNQVQILSFVLYELFLEKLNQ